MPTRALNIMSHARSFGVIGGSMRRRRCRSRRNHHMALAIIDWIFGARTIGPAPPTSSGRPEEGSWPR
jgi:hypothetical protein